MRQQQALTEALAWIGVAIILAVIVGALLGSTYAVVTFAFVLFVYAVSHL